MPLVIDVAVQHRLVSGLAARLKKRQKSAVRAVLRMVYKTEKKRLAQWQALSHSDEMRTGVV